MVEHDILPTDIVRYANDIWPDSMGVLRIAEMGKQLGEMADEVSDRTFYGAMLYFVGFYVLLLFDIVLSVQVETSRR